MTEINLTFIDIQKNTHIVRETILQHKKESACEDCKWIVSVIGYDHLTSVQAIEKNCLLKISMELDLLGSVINTLIKEDGFQEDNTYKPDFLHLKGAIIVYCE